MERQTSVRLDLGRFSISPNAIERVAREIGALGGPKRIQLESIDVTTRNGQLTYETVEQLRLDRVWEKRSRNFRLVFHEVGDGDRPGVRSIRIMGGEGTDNRIEVLGDEQDWVVGTGHNVWKIMKGHEVWHRHITHSLLVHIVYPVLAAVLLAYAVSYWLGVPISSMLGILSAPEFAGNYYYRVAILLPAIPLFFLAYAVPTRSRIVADKPWE